jgi:hypothetical protein
VGDTWITDLSHLLDESGSIAADRGPARRIAEYLTSIVAMASRPELVIPPEYRVQCRRRPGRKRCVGYIEVDLDADTEDIVWWCPVCGDNGYIRNWKGTVWDLSDAVGEPH